jgi:hypothetical protein
MKMDDLDFSVPGNKPLPKPAPAPVQLPPKPVYNAAMALEFFRIAGKAETPRAASSSRRTTRPASSTATRCTCCSRARSRW